MARFTQYKVFVAAFEMGSVSSAALHLNLSPSAVSKQLSSLESHLQVKLFERSNRNIKPTESGKAFYPRCKSILNEVMDAEQHLQTNRQALSGTIRITLSKSLLASGIIEKLKTFTDQHPDICFDIHTSEDVEDLHESEFDFALRLGKLEDHSQLVALPLQTVYPILCATQSYIKTYGNPQNYADLENHKFCHLPLTQLSQPVRNFFKKQQLNFNLQHHQANDIETINQMVLASMCIGMMLDVAVAVAKQIDDGTLIEVLPESRPPSKKLYLIFRKEGSPAARNSAFKNFIKAAYK